MSRTILITTAAVAAACFNGPLPAANEPSQSPPSVLWNQNSNFGQVILSENGDAAADDFVVPKGATWKISEVDVTGM